MGTLTSRYATVRRRRQAEQTVGVLQHYDTREGRKLKMRRMQAHSLADELCPPRKPIEPINGGWREFFEIIAGFLVLGSLWIGFLAWIAIAAAAAQR